MQLSDNARGIVLMNLAMASFTLNDTAMKVAMESLPMMQAITLRGVMTTLALLAMAWWMGVLRMGPVEALDRWRLGWRTVGEVGSTLAFLAALENMPIANLSAIMQVLPLAVALAAAVFLREALGWRQGLAIVVGLVGVLIIVRPGAEGFDRWALVGLLAVAFVVLRDLVTRQLHRGVPSVMVALMAALSVTLVGAVGMVWSGWKPVGLWPALTLVFAAGSLVFGYLTSVATMRVGDIAVVSPFRYTALLWAIVLGWLIFNQLPDRFTVIGSVLVVASGLFSLLQERGAQRRAARNAAPAR